MDEIVTVCCSSKEGRKSFKFSKLAPFTQFLRKAETRLGLEPNSAKQAFYLDMGGEITESEDLSSNSVIFIAVEGETAPGATAAGGKFLVDSGHPRPAETKMNALQAIAKSLSAPSSFGTAGEERGWPAEQQTLSIMCHRPHHFCGPPVVLCSEVFANFKKGWAKGVVLDEETCSTALDLCVKMSGDFSRQRNIGGQLAKQEEARKLLFASIVSKYLGRPLTPVGLAHNSSTDLAVCHQLHHHSIPIMNVEVKWELGKGTSDAFMENCLYYARIVQQHYTAVRDYCHSPCFLVALVGPWLCVSGAVWTEHACIDPLTPMIPLLFLKYDMESMFTVAKVLKLLKDGIKQLIEFYDNLSLSSPYDSWFPVARSCDFNDAGAQHKWKIVYKSQISSKLAYRADIVDVAVDPPAMLGNTVVKFTQFKPNLTVLHTAVCAGICPNVFGTVLVGDHTWHMLIMEDLSQQGYQLLNECELGDSEQKADFAAAVHQAVKTLHGNALVHGDLRFQNIMYSKTEKQVKFLDWDWAGEIGQAKYPAFLNVIDITWPKGVGYGCEIKVEHDTFWIDQIIQVMQSSWPEVTASSAASTTEDVDLGTIDRESQLLQMEQLKLLQRANKRKFGLDQSLSSNCSRCGLKKSARTLRDINENNNSECSC